jgi:hypothetical protein
MKKLIFSSLVGLALISFTACSHDNEVDAGSKCNAGKCQVDKAKSAKCAGDKKAAAKCSSAGKCGK